MSAITLFTFACPLVAPHACCECVRVAREETLRYTREPVVTPRWTIEVDTQGKRSLVWHWFRNERANSHHGDE